jgi:phosphatidylserine synthase
MSYQVFHWLMTALYIFCALMIVTKFVFYREKEQGMGPVYFWGGGLFFSLALTELTSALVYGTSLHVWKTLLFLALTTGSLIASIRQRGRQEVSVKVDVQAKAS